jgi:hypothetical protein
MTCLNCHKQGKNGKFCSNCGRRMMEKCFECGEMEWVGRKVCQTKLKEAKLAHEEVIKKALIVKSSKTRTCLALLLIVSYIGISYVGVTIIMEEAFKAHRILISPARTSGLSGLPFDVVSFVAFNVGIGAPVGVSGLFAYLWYLYLKRNIDKIRKRNEQIKEKAG